MLLFGPMMVKGYLFGVVLECMKEDICILFKSRMDGACLNQALIKNS